MVTAFLVSFIVAFPFVLSGVLLRLAADERAKKLPAVGVAGVAVIGVCGRMLAAMAPVLVFIAALRWL